MKRWFPIVGAIVALVAVNVVMRFWGTKSALVVLGLLLLGWWIAYTYADSALDRLYNEYSRYDDEMKKDFMARASAQIRAEIEKREADEKKA